MSQIPYILAAIDDLHSLLISVQKISLMHLSMENNVVNLAYQNSNHDDVNRILLNNIISAC